jgi:hypothetical protein
MIKKHTPEQRERMSKEHHGLGYLKQLSVACCVERKLSTKRVQNSLYKLRSQMIKPASGQTKAVRSYNRQP